MKRPVLLLLLLALGMFRAVAADLKVDRMNFDVQGRFTLEVPVPAGSRHALLEVFDPGPAATWRTLVSGPIDGRQARVIFRLPADHGPRALVRARTGTGTTVPPAELNDPALYTVLYESPIGEQAKIGFLGNAAAKMREWRSLPRPQSQAQLIAWAEANPLVEDATVSMPADNVSIRFTDGDFCVLLNKPREDGDPAPPSAFQSAAAAPELAEREVSSAGPRAVTGLSIPRSKQAIAAFSLESTFPNSAPKVAGWLDARGYDADIFASTTVLDVQSWSTSFTPLGVLFWHVHGCSYEKKDGSTGIGLVTREFASEALSKGPYAIMRQSGQLGLAIDDRETVPYYVLTSSFVTNHMRFAPNSLVVIDACFAGHQELASAFLASGAGSYASWDWLSGPESGTPCKQLFDRLLGMNDQAPLSAVKERSFALPTVMHWMSKKGYDYDPSTKFPGQTRTNAKLTWFHRTTNPAHMLRPSIMRILQESSSPGQPFSKYLLEGDFGDDPGTGKRTVLWGGKPLEVLTWDEQEGIVIRIPKPAPVGNFQVLIQREFENKSNEVPMTEWTVPFTFDRREQGSLHANIVANVKIRADVHGERYEPEGPVNHIWKSYWNMADCTGKLKASGSYRPSENSLYTWSGGADLVSVDAATGEDIPPNLIQCGGTFTGDGVTLSFHLFATGLFTETYSWSGGSETYDQQADLNSTPFFHPFPTIKGPTFTVPGGNKTHSSGTRTETLVWPATTPAFPPVADTPR